MSPPDYEISGLVTNMWRNLFDIWVIKMNHTDTDRVIVPPLLIRLKYFMYFTVSVETCCCFFFFLSVLNCDRTAARDGVSRRL